MGLLLKVDRANHANQCFLFLSTRAHSDHGEVITGPDIAPCCCCDILATCVANPHMVVPASYDQSGTPPRIVVALVTELQSVELIEITGPGARVESDLALRPRAPLLYVGIDPLD